VYNAGASTQQHQRRCCPARGNPQVDDHGHDRRPATFLQHRPHLGLAWPVLRPADRLALWRQARREVQARGLGEGLLLGLLRQLDCLCMRLPLQAGYLVSLAQGICIFSLFEQGLGQSPGWIRVGIVAVWLLQVALRHL